MEIGKTQFPKGWGPEGPRQKQDRKVRGWVAQQVEKGGSTNDGSAGRAHRCGYRRRKRRIGHAAEAACAAQEDDTAAAARAKSLANREKAVSAAASWMDQNEEQARNGVEVMRPEKIDKMRRDREGVWATAN